MREHNAAKMLFLNVSKSAPVTSSDIYDESTPVSEALSYDEERYNDDEENLETERLSDSRIVIISFI